MAVKAAKIEKHQKQALVVVTWEALSAGDTGDPVLVANFPDKTVQASGNATTVALEGTNFPLANAQWFPLTDPGGTTIALAGATDDMALVTENPLYVRPVATGGTDTDVILVGVSAK